MKSEKNNLKTYVWILDALEPLCQSVVKPEAKKYELSQN